MTATLTHEQREMLDFESRRWKYSGSKDRAIREEFGLSPTAYYVRLARLIQRQEALAYAPMLVKRLRDSRTTVRRAEG